MIKLDHILTKLYAQPKRWLVTGAAGFVGSNLVEYLLDHNQSVVGIDNFSTGYMSNLQDIEHSIGAQKWKNFLFVENDIRHIKICHEICEGIDYVLHQAALGSIPRSIHDPIATNSVNIDGFLNMLTAAKEAKVKSFTFASSSSVYGDHTQLPKIEDTIGTPSSPYAVTKYVNELYAEVFSKVYQFNSIGLRYFNVFGPRQNRNGPYAAVIPKWTTAMIHQEDIEIYGDGETCRDFCYIENVIQANILAATADETAKNQIYNIALNQMTSLKQLFEYIKLSLITKNISYDKEPQYQDFRQGDMRHSKANIDKAIHLLGYAPQYEIKAGLEKSIAWFIKHAS